MNKNCRKLPTQFGPETRFEMKPASLVTFRATENTELERLKKRLLRERLNETAGLELNVRLRCAANEAAALAWVTPFPLLVFPTLFEEKARIAQVQAERQACVRQRSLELLAV